MNKSSFLLLTTSFSALLLVACGSNDAGASRSPITAGTSVDANSSPAVVDPNITGVKNAVTGTISGQTLTPNSVSYGISDSNTLVVIVSDNPQECQAQADYNRPFGEVALTFETTSFTGAGNYPITPVTVHAVSPAVRLQQKAGIGPGTHAYWLNYTLTGGGPHVGANGIGSASAGSLNVTSDNSAKLGNLEGDFSFDFGSAGHISGTFQATYCKNLNHP